MDGVERDVGRHQPLPRRRGRGLALPEVEQQPPECDRRALQGGLGDQRPAARNRHVGGARPLGQRGERGERALVRRARARHKGREVGAPAQADRGRGLAGALPGAPGLRIRPLRDVDELLQVVDLAGVDLDPRCAGRRARVRLCQLLLVDPELRRIPGLEGGRRRLVPAERRNAEKTGRERRHAEGREAPTPWRSPSRA